MHTSFTAVACQIHLKGNFAARGFGFSCLKQAAELKLTGSLQYENAESILILLRGDETAVDSFYKWCEQVSEVHQIEKKTTGIASDFKYEFQIMNSI